MIDQRFWKRALATFSLLAHLVLVGAGPVADARLELADLLAAKGPAHVEDESLPSCARHQHATCLVFRTLQHLDLPAVVRQAPTVDGSSDRRPPVAPRDFSRGDGWLTSVSPRAPPDTGSRGRV